VDTVDADVADQLLPTLREALANVAKHARARHVRVVVQQVGDRTTVTVTDDGTGPGDRPPGADGGHGLQNLRARAREVGGDLVVTPGQPSGTTLTWTAVAARPTARDDGAPSDVSSV
jgi:signal transduction histidine kinase